VLVRAAGSAPDDDWSEELALDRARHDLAATAERLRRDGLAVDWLARPGEAGPAILGAVRERTVDLVAMATHGRGVLGPWPYGSVADEVIRGAAGLPVLLVPASCDASRHAVAPRILVLLDGSAFAEQVLPATGELARAMGGTVVLLRAGDSATSERLAARRSYLESVAAAPALGGVAVEVRAEAGDVTSSAVSSAIGADLIAMATHGRTGLARVLVGSVAAEVLRRTACPVLVVRPVGLRGEGDDPGSRERQA
jgi:nucleotide-binding universal stress UspA family protein